MDDYKSAIVYFRNGTIWQGPAGMVSVEHKVDAPDNVYPNYYESTISGRYKYAATYPVLTMEATIYDDIKITGIAERVTFCKKALPKTISYGE